MNLKQEEWKDTLLLADVVGCKQSTHNLQCGSNLSDQPWKDDVDLDFDSRKLCGATNFPTFQSFPTSFQQLDIKLKQLESEEISKKNNKYYP